MFRNENFQFSKCRLRRLQQARNKLFTEFESQHEILCSDTICFWIGFSSFKWLHLNCGANSAILPDEALLELAIATDKHRFYNKNSFPLRTRGC